MLPYQILIVINKQADTAVYQQIANSLVKLIRSGIIKPGTALPSSRNMAAMLQVHRKTIVAAYEELFVQDWVETQPRKGIIVNQRLPDVKPRSFKPGQNQQAYAGEAAFTFKQFTQITTQPANPGVYKVLVDDGFLTHE